MKDESEKLFLKIPLLSQKEFEALVRKAVQDFIENNVDHPKTLSNDILSGGPKFDIEDLEPFYDRWYGIINLPDGVAVLLDNSIFSSPVYWIISTGDVMLFVNGEYAE